MAYRVLRQGFVAACVAVVAACDRPPGQAAEAPVDVFSAASTAGVLEQLGRSFEQLGGPPIRVSGGSSGLLARQIIAGARPDLYLGAHPRWVDELERHGLVVPGGRVELLANELVLVTRPERTGVRLEPGFDVVDALPGGLAIADPVVAPAGRYARQVLDALGWSDRPGLRLVTTADVRGALRLAELGEVDAALVYVTDAVGSERLSLAARVDPSLHEPIRYVLVPLADAQPSANRFMEYLRGPDGRDAFSSAGFTLVDPEPAR